MRNAYFEAESVFAFEGFAAQGAFGQYRQPAVTHVHFIFEQTSRGQDAVEKYFAVEHTDRIILRRKFQGIGIVFEIKPLREKEEVFVSGMDEKESGARAEFVFRFRDDLLGDGKGGGLVFCFAAVPCDDKSEKHVIERDIVVDDVPQEDFRLGAFRFPASHGGKARL